MCKGMYIWEILAGDGPEGKILKSTDSHSMQFRRKAAQICSNFKASTEASKTLQVPCPEIKACHACPECIHEDIEAHDHLVMDTVTATYPNFEYYVFLVWAFLWQSFNTPDAHHPFCS